MKKYLLKLIEKDILQLKKWIESDKQLLTQERFKNDNYFIKRLLSYEKKLKVVENYKKRIENNL